MGTVETVFSGYNCSVFAYGATGAGKTHTMLGTPDDPGVIARTVRALYEKIDLMKEKNNDSLYDVSVQYLEVYNEKINDLLTDHKHRMTSRTLSIRICWMLRSARITI